MTKPNRTLITGGTVVLGQTVSRQDVLIEGEQIAAVGNLGDCQADVCLDAEGLLALPGAIDTHVHLNDVFMKTVSVHDYYTGTLAAAYGGVTSIVDFSNQVPGGSLMKCIRDKEAEADGLVLVDWGVHTVITQPTDETLAEIQQVVQAGAPTLKCYMTYREDGLMIEIKDLKRILAGLHDAGGMLMVHAEDNDMIEKNVPRLLAEGKTQAHYHAVSKPPEVEDKAIRDCIQMVREVGGRLFVVHLASDVGLELIAHARAEGVNVVAETCIHYLLFTDDIMKRDDGVKWVCSPPLRNKSIQDKLWAGLQDGRIAMVTTDDAAYSWEAKLYGQDSFDQCPNGLPGIEVRLNMLYSEGVAKGRLSLPRFVELMATAPANLFGLAPQKGSLAPGTDADIVLFDPQAKWVMSRDTLHMATDWSAYENVEVTGKIRKVFSRGELIIDGKQCLAQKGRGRYLHRKLDPSIWP